MKIAPLSYDELIAKGKDAEGAGEINIVMTSYQKAVKLQPGNPFTYNRLIIIFRKETMYKEKLQLINNAISNIQATSNAPAK